MADSKKYLYYGLGVAVVIIIILLAIILNLTRDNTSIDVNQQGPGTNDQQNVGDNSEPSDDGTNILGINKTWTEIEIKDVNTNLTFKVDDLKGKDVLINFFILGCQNCQDQQNNMDLLRNEGFELMALDLSIGDKEDSIKNYAKNQGFEWKFAKATEQMNYDIKKKFNAYYGNVEFIKVVLVCKDGSYRELGNRLRSSSALKAEVEKGCNI